MVEARKSTRCWFQPRSKSVILKRLWLSTVDCSISNLGARTALRIELGDQFLALST